MNIELLYDATCRLTVVYSLYSGSINDLTYFPTMMGLAEELGVDFVFYIFDLGFITKNNLLFVEK